MGAQAVALVFMVSILSVCNLIGAADTLEQQCASNFQKLTGCLTFATGKSTTPTKDCCTSVASIKDTKAVCLCYIIQQIHSGANPQFKSFGIQEDKLLELPSACKLASASSSDCPKLLNLPANSPDAAIFKDPSPSTATPAAPGGTSPSKKTDDSSNGIMHVPEAVAISIAIAAAAAVFLFHIFMY